MSFRRISIVIEWDNANLAELDRCRQMLVALNHQTRALQQADAPAIEVIVVYDSDDVSEEFIRGTMGQYAPDPVFDLQVIACPGDTYFRLKHRGVQQSQGDVLVFLDSDLIPEDNWLPTLLSAFEQPEVQIVGGHVYVDPTDVYAKAFTLGWFFELPEKRNDLALRDHFFANSVAYRREVYERFPFEDVDGAVKTSNLQQIQQLQQNGIPIHVHWGARARHPAPRPRNFFTRAMAQARDEAMLLRALDPRPHPRSYALSDAFRRWSRKAGRAMRSIRGHRARANLAAPMVPAALGIMGTYYGVYLLGSVLSVLAPGFMRRNFEQ